MFCWIKQNSPALTFNLCMVPALTKSEWIHPGVWGSRSVSDRRALLLFKGRNQNLKSVSIFQQQVVKLGWSSVHNLFSYYTSWITPPQFQPDWFIHSVRWGCENTFMVPVGPAEFSAQTLSLSYFNGGSVRWGRGYKIRILSEQSDSLEML